MHVRSIGFEAQTQIVLAAGGPVIAVGHALGVARSGRSRTTLARSS